MDNVDVNDDTRDARGCVWMSATTRLYCLIQQDICTLCTYEIVRVCMTTNRYTIYGQVGHRTRSSTAHTTRQRYKILPCNGGWWTHWTLTWRESCGLDTSRVVQPYHPHTSILLSFAGNTTPRLLVHLTLQYNHHIWYILQSEYDVLPLTKHATYAVRLPSCTSKSNGTVYFKQCNRANACRVLSRTVKMQIWTALE